MQWTQQMLEKMSFLSLENVHILVQLTFPRESSNFDAMYKFWDSPSPTRSHFIVDFV